MCVVSAVWLTNLQGSAFYTVLGLYIFYLLIILLISYIILFRKKGLRWTVQNQLNNLKSLLLKTTLVSERVFERFPGAVAISLGTYIQAFYLML